MPPTDVGNQAGPWWISAGAILIGIITAVTPLLVQRWRDRGASSDDVDRPGLNASVVAITEAKPRGMTGVQLTTMLKTVDELSDRLNIVEGELNSAHQEITELKRHDSQRQWAYDQAIAWGINAQDPPPRVIPQFLIEFMSNPPHRP